MSLDWQAQQVKQWHTYTQDEKNVISQGVVFEMMFCSVREVNETNEAEVFQRIEMRQRLLGTILTEGIADPDDATKCTGIRSYYITKDDVHRAALANIRTNVPDRTRAQFTKHLWDMCRDALKSSTKLGYEVNK